MRWCVRVGGVCGSGDPVLGGGVVWCGGACGLRWVVVGRGVVWVALGSKLWCGRG